MHDPITSCSFFLGLLLIAVCLAVIRLILRWFLGVLSLQRRVEVLERIVPPRLPGPPFTLSPKEMTVVVGEPPLTFRDLPGELSLLTLANGRPGLARLAVTVNGASYELSDLADGEERTLDLSSSMQPNDRNALTLQGEGAETASARVTLTTF
jgi:hypothetical protein